MGTPPDTWVKFERDDERTWSVAFDPSGNVVAGGSFSDRMNLGGGLMTAVAFTAGFVGKLTGSGTEVWHQQVDGSNGTTAAYVYEVATDSAGAVLAAGTANQTVAAVGGDSVAAGGFLMKFSANDGSHVWSKRVGDGYPFVVTEGTDIFLSLRSDAPVDFGSGTITPSATSLFVARLNSAGAPTWTKEFIDFSSGQPRIAARGTQLVIADSYTGSFSLDGSAFNAGSNYHLFVVGLDPSDGSVAWSRDFPSASTTGFGFRALDIAPNGDVLVTGSSPVAIDLGGGTLNAGAFALRLDSTGQHVWSASWVTDDVPAAVFGPDGVIHLAGNNTSSVDFGGGALPAGNYVVKLAADGTHLWSRGGDAGTARAFAADSAGSVVFAGEWAGDFNAFGLMQPGPVDSADNLFFAVFPP